MAKPRNIPVDQLNAMRAEVAKEYGISLYKQYAEKQAAEFLRLDVSTVKRNRRAGRVPYVEYGNGGVRFMGVMLCDYILFGADSVQLWGGQPKGEDDEGESDAGAPVEPNTSPHGGAGGAAVAR